MLVYKYLPPERIDVLRNGRIRFTQPAALNDPFECSPQLDISAPLESLRSAACDELDSMLTQFLVAPELSSEDRDRARQEVELAKRELSTQMDPVELSTNCVGGIRSLLSESIGVLSLSKTPTSTTMWAHYGSNHSGFLLGLDADSEWLHMPDASGRLTPMWAVEYADKPALIPVDGDGQLALEGDALYLAMIGTKLHDWKYEQEIRITRSFLGDHDSVGVDSLGYPIRLFYIEKEAIKRVVVGSRADSELVKEIVNLLDAHGLGAVELMRAEVNRERHQLELVPCS